jgi:hypothetical protein
MSVVMGSSERTPLLSFDLTRRFLLRLHSEFQMQVNSSTITGNFVKKDHLPQFNVKKDHL